MDGQKEEITLANMLLVVTFQFYCAGENQYTDLGILNYFTKTSSILYFYLEFLSHCVHHLYRTWLYM